MSSPVFRIIQTFWWTHRCIYDTNDARKAHNELYKAKLAPKEFSAIRELFPSARTTARLRGRRAILAAA